MYVSMYVSMMYVSMYVSIYLSVYLSIYLSIYLRKLLFPISLQLKGTRLPQENWCCFRLIIIIRLGLYVYICIDCQSSILSHMVPELINNLICWNCKGCIGKSIDPVQYRFTIPSLLAQCHVAGSMSRCWLSAS